ncbi:hypothetical protein FQR65_LT03554 [Abscondita terminalis]|nr:hypothetical protein FQR65_LT03554 [Abscondita terminalis]
MSQAEVAFEDVKKPKNDELPKEVFKDDAKWILVPSKVILKSLCVWPETQNKLNTFISVFIIFNYGLLLTHIMRYIIHKDTNLAGAAYAITGFMVAAESVMRRILLMIFAKRFSRLLQVVYYDFWPSDITGKGVISKASVLIVIATIGYFSAGYSYIFNNLIGLFYERKIPFQSVYPFDHTKSPMYELVYVWQSLLLVEFDVHLTVFDFFLAGLISNCVAQFKLLRRFLIQNFEKAIKMAETDPEKATDEAYKLILLIFRRHNNLIAFWSRICKEIDEMLSMFTLVMYIGNVATLCSSSFLLAVARAEGMRPLIYFWGHLSQILFYCSSGHDLSLESTALADAVYQCGWHLLPYNRNLRKALILIMQRAQRPLTMTIGGFGILNLASYMKLLQFCFSVYVLLSKMEEKTA